MVKTHVVLVLLWVLFGVLHSLFADATVKRRFAQAAPRWAPHYRLLYTGFAFLTLGIVVAYLLSATSVFLYRPTTSTRVVGAVVGAAGLVVMGICIKKYFMSLSGVRSLFEEQPKHRLMITGIHRHVRHPLYLGTFLALWGSFLFYPLLSLLVTNIAITAYTLVGIGFEEKKLVLEFGDDYRTYRQTVPKLVPRLRPKPIA